MPDSFVPFAIVVTLVLCGAFASLLALFVIRVFLHPLLRRLGIKRS